MTGRHDDPLKEFTASRDALDAVVQDDSVPLALRTTARYVLWEVCQGCGDPAAARLHLDAAMRHDPLQTRLVAGATPVRSVLRLAAPGDFQANIPLEMLLDGSTLLHTLWIVDPEAVIADPGSAFRSGVPAIDCVFIGIAQDLRHRVHLRAADALARWLGRPTINDGAGIDRLSRDGTARLLGSVPHLRVPVPVMADRQALLLDPPAYPFIVRPLASHAGRALRRLDRRQDVLAYLAEHADEREFFATPFIDFAGADGRYRKYRVVVVDGEPFPVHLAIHDDWAVWYYNAGMEHDAGKREEEARFLAGMPAVFGPKAMAALGEIARRVGLDYFGLDCALAGDGQLIVFEIETGMIVHDRDPPGLFAYKKQAVRRISSAFERMVERRSRSARARSEGLQKHRPSLSAR